MPDQYTLLLELRRSEGANRGLAKLPHDFYGTTSAYLTEVRRTFESELRENPSGRKGELSRQTYQRASQVARDIIEARMTKLLSLAFQASVGGAKEIPNTLPEERGLFESLTGVLRTHRGSVAPYLQADAGPPAAPTGTPAPAASRDSTPRVEPRPTRAAAAQALVRILKDSRPLELGGETIELRREDIVSLPPEVARILVDGKIAEALQAEFRPTS
ncbi:MAG: DNA replication complex GINS family protein [Thermoplasmata archaeon]|nr:DNA replication complex GINS family protein [Thermoplasmata archaeon]MCI4359361.1 DNA replication complex GINS family protein [Thermoplasmata archaeon]